MQNDNDHDGDSSQGRAADSSPVGYDGCSDHVTEPAHRGVNVLGVDDFLILIEGDFNLSPFLWEVFILGYSHHRYSSKQAQGKNYIISSVK
jgi:hypothetical protein